MKYKLNCLLQYALRVLGVRVRTKKERERGKRELSSELFYVKKIETGGQSD